MPTRTRRTIGVAWYRRQDYESIIGVMKDSPDLPATFEEWQLRAQGTAQRIIADGFVVEPVYLDPTTFPAWCEARGLSPDATARNLFAKLKAATVQHTLH